MQIRIGRNLKEAETATDAINLIKESALEVTNEYQVDAEFDEVEQRKICRFFHQSKNTILDLHFSFFTVRFFS